LAATQNILYLTEPRQRVVMCDDVYGGTWRLADKVWSRYGINVDPVDVTNPDAVRAAVSPEAVRERGPVGLVWIETPTNPLLKLADIQAAAEVARQAGALTVVDNTFATPYLQQPLALGADIVMHSATKYLGGHSDVVGGLVATNRDDLAEQLRFHQNAAGAVPSPFDCWLVLRGIRTLPYRVRAQSEHALKLATFLAGHPRVERVHYPGLPTSPGHEIARRQMAMFGGTLSVQIKGDAEAAMAVAAKLRVFTRATSFGGTESLVEHRASIEGPGTTTPVNLLRVAIGLEHPDDLIEDFAQALG